MGAGISRNKCQKAGKNRESVVNGFGNSKTSELRLKGWEDPSEKGKGFRLGLSSEIPMWGD